MTASYESDNLDCAKSFERLEELSHLKEAVIRKRHSMLVFAEEGAGKTRLLQQLAATSTKILYVPHCASPTDLLSGILVAIQRTNTKKSELKMVHRSLLNTKGVVQNALAKDDWTLVIDHVQSPSVALGHLVKELNYYNRTPIVFAGRSEHMEDIGSFRSLCTERASRLELKPWSNSIALQFARRQACLLGLDAENLEETIRGIAEKSNGYPGPILKMLTMAKDPAYRLGEQIKFHVVWLDYKLGRSGTASGNMKPHSKH